MYTSMLTILAWTWIVSSHAIVNGVEPKSPSLISLAVFENRVSGSQLSSSNRAWAMSTTNSLNIEKRTGAPADPNGNLKSI